MMFQYVQLDKLVDPKLTLAATTNMTQLKSHVPIRGQNEVSAARKDTLGQNKKSRPWRRNGP